MREVVVFLQHTKGKAVYFLTPLKTEPTEIDFQPFVKNLAEQGVYSREGGNNPRQSREAWYYSLLKKNPCTSTSWAIRKAAEGAVSYVARMPDGSFAAVRTVVLPPGSTFLWEGGGETKKTPLAETAYDLIEARQEGLAAAITSSLFGHTSVQRLSFLSDYGRAVLAPRLELPEELAEPAAPSEPSSKKQKGVEPCRLAGVAPGDEASFAENESDVSSSTVDELFVDGLFTKNDESDDAELVAIQSSALAPDATTKSEGGSPISPSPPPISCELRLQGGGPKGAPGGQRDDMPQLEWSAVVDLQLPLLQPVAYHLPPPPPPVALWERPTEQDKAYEPLQLPEWTLAEFHALLWEVYEDVVVAPLESKKVHTPFTRIYDVLERAAMKLPWKRAAVWMRFHQFCEKVMRRLEVKDGVIVEFPIGTASRTVVHGGAATMCTMYALWWHKEGHHPPPLGESRTRMGLALPVAARAKAPPAPTPPEMWANRYTGDMRRLYPEADIWPKLRAMRGSADARAHQRQRQRRRNGQGAAQSVNIPHATLLHTPANHACVPIVQAAPRSEPQIDNQAPAPRSQAEVPTGAAHSASLYQLPPPSPPASPDVQLPAPPLWPAAGVVPFGTATQRDGGHWSSTTSKVQRVRSEQDAVLDEWLLAAVICDHPDAFRELPLPPLLPVIPLEQMLDESPKSDSCLELGPFSPPPSPPSPPEGELRRVLAISRVAAFVACRRTQRLELELQQAIRKSEVEAEGVAVLGALEETFHLQLAVSESHHSEWTEHAQRMAAMLAETEHLSWASLASVNAGSTIGQGFGEQQTPYRESSRSLPIPPPSPPPSPPPPLPPPPPSPLPTPAPQVRRLHLRGGGAHCERTTRTATALQPATGAPIGAGNAAGAEAEKAAGALSSGFVDTRGDSEGRERVGVDGSSDGGGRGADPRPLDADPRPAANAATDRRAARRTLAGGRPCEDGTSHDCFAQVAVGAFIEDRFADAIGVGAMACGRTTLSTGISTADRASPHRVPRQLGRRGRLRLRGA